MNKEIIQQLQNTVESFVENNGKLNKEIQSNKNLYGDIFKQFKTRARAIDENIKEVIDYLNSIDCEEILTNLYVYKQFCNYTTFYNSMKLKVAQNGSVGLEITHTTQDSGTQNFTKFEDFIDECANSPQMNYTYIERLCEAIIYCEERFIKAIYDKIDYICKEINTAKQEELSKQKDILSKIGIDALHKVVKYKVTIEIIEE